MVPHRKTIEVCKAAQNQSPRLSWSPQKSLHLVLGGSENGLSVFILQWGKTADREVGNYGDAQPVDSQRPPTPGPARTVSHPSQAGRAAPVGTPPEVPSGADMTPPTVRRAVPIPSCLKGALPPTVSITRAHAAPRSLLLSGSPLHHRPKTGRTQRQPPRLRPTSPPL